MDNVFKHIETKLIHSGEPDPRILGAVSMPIFQSAMYETYGGEGYHDIAYIRLNNTPNHAALHDKLAALENAESALVTASGMAAITTSLLTLLSSGDHVLFQPDLYGGTRGFVINDLPALGIAYDFIDASTPDSWESKLRAKTKVIYVETISNPLMGVGDLEAVVNFAKSHNLVSIIDNTFASPINFRPPELGYDLSIHSCTKYLNGHSDIVAGTIIGRRDLVEKIKHKLDHLGGSLDPHACFLLHRGLKTLALRVQYQNDSALKIANFLNDHPKIAKVNYPGLETHPAHERALKLFDGCGGMLSYELKGDAESAEQFLKSVKLPIIAPSLGGVESLLTRPALTSHAGISAEEREETGITDTLIRMSVGIEATVELIEDLDQALKAS
ncbi:MAG: aminotransferase class I/II-fold pyridoxal phosphate-dependent enzyme [Candidatus Latescibacteria bacterium]|nr:aminotransferase class I/II-fold pyridoxal phosphate-dependent enzyme [Candidatus Latescibacterota bacterium]NIM21158.1 aminotransferase class I/II-fold pyridoxal phosphate-dependent enzyme [Candidatus Latescibacterota bacterium]NIM65293.1 aminotransferase class I/II-fold pyridoxal phosphate-dependent enzyme [Candidatus Latescibacterota bacterium]NIO01808.1 aminotransferase class I/II-fold pyridoxal phosphate-dependent enzyme [Candidatus Latescibacterota bacterium]NIO28325.1 aminotransferase